MKKYLKPKFIIPFLLFITIVKISTIIGWELYAEEWVNERYTFTATLEQSTTTQPTTIDGMIDEMARDYLKSPEAFEWAIGEVTKETVEELSKI